MTLATKLVFLRKQKGLTQMELAEKLNVSRQAISRWEVGAAVPGMDNIKILCEMYDVSIDSLLSDDKDLICNNIDSQAQEKDKVKWVNKLRRIIFCILLLFVLIVCCRVIVQEQEPEQIAQIDELETIVEDIYPTGIFTIE